MPRNILYISANGFPASSSDGRGAFSFEHVLALEGEGANVRAIDSGSDGFRHDEVGGVAIERLPRVRKLVRKFDLAGLRQYANRILDLRRGSHDTVIFSFFYMKYLPLLLLLRRRDVIVLFIAHGGDVMPGGLLRRAIKRWMFDLADLVTPVSDFTATLFSCLIGRKDRDNDKIVTIDNGVNWKKLVPSLPAGAIRERLGIPAEAFVVLSVCNLIPRKGIDMLVEANLGLLAQGADLHHVIVGRGEQRDMLETRIADAGQSHRFHFVERVESSELADFYGTADLFAMISKTGWSDNRTEGFGVTYAEAMAMGTPVLGGSGCGATTPVKHGFNGLLVDPHAHNVVEQIATNVRRFMEDETLRETMGANAKWFATTFLDWSINARQTLSALDQAAQRRKIAS